MTAWVLVPHGLFLFALALLFRPSGRPRSTGTSVRNLAALAAPALILAALCPGSLVRTTASEGWQEATREADTAVVFGFGLCRTPGGALAPGESNRRLLDWTVKHTRARTILVQEGVWVAACASTAESCTFEGRTLERMHRHVRGVRVDTFEAAVCAAKRLRRAESRRVVVVAHDLQLAQAAHALARAMRDQGSTAEVVIPDLPEVPFPGCGLQLQTASPLLYKPVALWWARPRDFLRRVPASCPAPCGEICAPIGL